MNRRRFFALLSAATAWAFRPARSLATPRRGRLFIAGRGLPFRKAYPGGRIFMDGRDITAECYAFREGEDWAACYQMVRDADGKKALPMRKNGDDPIPTFELRGRLEIRCPTTTS